MQQCNDLPGPAFATKHSALDLYSELCWLEIKVEMMGSAKFLVHFLAHSKFSGK
jgi:hypothetical protein